MLAPPEKEQRIVAEIGAAYAREYGRVPTTWWSRASAGARREAVG
jgi:hypothetical protein